MANINIRNGARVVGAAGEEIGIVDQVVESDTTGRAVVRVTHGDRILEVPWDAIDTARSTSTEIVLADTFGRNETPLAATYEQFHQTLQLQAEELHVDVHEVDLGRVVVDKTVERVPVRHDVEIGTDNVEVRRVPGGEEFDELPEPRYEGDTLIIPVVEEVLVISRRYRVIEEVHVIRHRDTHIEQIEDELQREVVTVREELNDGSVRDL